MLTKIKPIVVDFPYGWNVRHVSEAASGLVQCLGERTGADPSDALAHLALDLGLA